MSCRIGGTLTLMGKAAQGGVIVVMLIALVGLAATLRNLVEIAQA